MLMNPVEGLILNSVGAWSSPIIEYVTTLNGVCKENGQNVYKQYKSITEHHK